MSLEFVKYHTAIKFTISRYRFSRYNIASLFFFSAKSPGGVGSALIVMYGPTYAIKSNLLIRLLTF